MIVLLAMALMMVQGDSAADRVKQFPAADVEKQVAKMLPVTLEKGDKHTVMINRRNKAGESEVHAVDTDVFYVTDGSATFTTGGTIVGGKTTAPGETRGSAIKGGKARRIAKGDILTIPHGTPHWFSEVQGTVTYLIVKIATGPGAK